MQRGRGEKIFNRSTLQIKIMPKKIFEEMGKVDGKTIYSVRFEQTDDEKAAEKAKNEEWESGLAIRFERMNKACDEMLRILKEE